MAMHSTFKTKKASKKRLRRIRQQQATQKKAHPLAVWSLVLGIIGSPWMLLFILFAWFALASYASLAITLFIILFALAIAPSLTGMLLSIRFIKKYKDFSTHYSGKDPAMIGLNYV